MKKLREWMSIQRAKNPGGMVLAAILLFNVVFLLISAFVISRFSLRGTEQMGFLQAAFCTVAMILDAGCVQFVVEDIGTSGVAIALVCLIIVLIGMISFTGAVIGYITNYISNFISNANNSRSPLRISNHTVILNWNTRASEIVNDLLYSREREKVVVLVGARREEIESEISERLADTLAKEKEQLRRDTAHMSFFERRRYMFRTKDSRPKMSVTFIVREGDVFSSKQLRDIRLDMAKSVIILGNDVNNSVCKYETRSREKENRRGNAQTIKTLMQVADITSAETSADKQKIIVEVTEPGTLELVNKIIKRKQVDAKCNIVPVCVNEVLGQILSQFSIMPELNLVYRELFSNKGAAFFTAPAPKGVSDEKFISEYLKNHRNAIPVSSLTTKGERYFYFVADSDKSIDKTAPVTDSSYRVKLNTDYWIEHKHVIMLGHNSNCGEIMKGFAAFRCEWDLRNKDKSNTEEILKITVIDDKENLERMNYYREYPFVVETKCADIYDKDVITDTINNVMAATPNDVSILILSDDSALNEDIDASALANLIYVQDIVKDKKDENPDFDLGSLDIIVEIIDPKHHDIVNSYNVNNVVISNRYISKMITQIGEKEAIYNFYNDILTYDINPTRGYESKEIYTKHVRDFFEEIPAPCTAEELIRAVYYASVSDSRLYPTMVLGYVKSNGKMVIFSGNQSETKVELSKGDKIIVYTPH